MPWSRHVSGTLNRASDPPAFLPNSVGLDSAHPTGRMTGCVGNDELFARMAVDVSLPYSPDKRYLTGIDWVINTLHSITRHATGHGNNSQILMTLEGRLDPDELRSAVSAVLQRHPVLTGRVARDWNLCPYWDMEGRAPAEVPVTVGPECDDWVDAFETFQIHANLAFSSPRHHLQFHLVHETGRRSHVGMRFDHRLVDAAGAEAILELMHRIHAGETAGITNQISLTEPAHLDQWERRFVGGRAVNQLQVRLSRGEVRACPVPPGGPRPKTRFNCVTLSPQETKKMKERAFSEARAPMLLPSMVASVIGGLHRVAERRPLVGDRYVIPVSVVDRTPAEKWEKLLFNHISFIIFRVPVETANSRLDLVPMLRDQLFEQMEKDLPEHIYHASMLTRIVPLELMRCLAKIPMRGKVATSYFACLRESAYEPDSFLGHKVENMIHMPHVPPPPGLGVFVNGYGGRMNLVLSHLDGVLRCGEPAQLISSVRRGLLG